ncbi:hypothetical protein ACQP2F_40980 [Actinoplanes sp. CA-030573]|uniref:hypothetical protein n=1 Tax=Actinoplanes sp. CA-030573 TaxID=3239898 RepID=UPI003D8D09DB
MTTTTTAAEIPAAEHGTGFTAVPLAFPDRAEAHRIERLHHPDVRADADDPTSKILTRAWTEVRPACSPDSDPADRFYELSVPYALARGAQPCGWPECYGGAA